MSDQLAAAEQLFDEAVARELGGDLVLWNSMLAALARARTTTAARRGLVTYQRMRSLGVAPDQTTISAVMGVYIFEYFVLFMLC